MERDWKQDMVTSFCPLSKDVSKNIPNTI